MSFECDLGWEYFGPDPMNSPRMQEHMDWHNDPQNQGHLGNYGTRFLEFHRQYIQKFDNFRVSKGLLPVTGWDPSTQIPADLAHDHVLVTARATDNPSAVDPLCKTPTWATLAGGIDPDPLHGYTSLTEFQNEDELGKSIDHGWHGKVHNTISGDMKAFHSPIDPVFWRWHKWIDDVRASWEIARTVRAPRDLAAFVQILFGIINDAPGVWIGPDGKPHRWPGPDPSPFRTRLTAPMRDALIGLAAHSMGEIVENREAREGLQKIGIDLVNMQTKLLLTPRAEAKELPQAARAASGKTK